MKKITALISILILTLCLCGCSTFSAITDYFKADETTHKHSHNHEHKDEETTENLNYKVIDATEPEEKSEAVKDKTTTKKSDSSDSDPQYPYVDVNDGDTKKYEWPTEGVAAEFPELKSGTMKKPFVSKNLFSVYYANVVPEEFDEYLDLLKKSGFEVENPEDFSYSAKNNKISIEFFYDTSKLGKNTLSLIARYL